MEKVLFKEEKQFRQLWLWILLIASYWLPLTLLIRPLVKTWVSGSKDFLLLVFISAFILVFALVCSWLFKSTRFVVEVRIDGIWYKFPPLLYKWKCIQKNEIEKYEVRTYRPVSEYGGWGIKGGSKNKAYNVSGNIGLQLYLKNGKKILFGTQKKQTIKTAMDKFMKI